MRKLHYVFEYQLLNIFQKVLNYFRAVRAFRAIFVQQKTPRMNLKIKSLKNQNH